MTPDECYEIGRVVRPHGLKGALHIQLDVDDPMKYEKMESVFVLTGETLVPFFIKSIQLSGNKGIVELEDINSVDAANALKSSILYLPLELLPTLQDGQFYFHQVIGYTIVDDVKGTLGIIETITSSGAQDIISMKYNDVEVLIPVSDEIVKSANHEKREVYVNLPIGLLEIYLS